LFGLLEVVNAARTAGLRAKGIADDQNAS